MSNESIEQIVRAADRYKLYAVLCDRNKLEHCIKWLKSQNVGLVNLGKEIANFIDQLNDQTYLALEVYDYLKLLFENHQIKNLKDQNKPIALYNLGILFEPSLRLNPVQVLRDFSKVTTLIIIWENEAEVPGHLTWGTQKNLVNFDFTEFQIKTIRYDIQ
jgi:hypothetical protein